jgi:hypothetical protein
MHHMLYKQMIVNKTNNKSESEQIMVKLLGKSQHKWIKWFLAHFLDLWMTEKELIEGVHMNKLSGNKSEGGRFD